MYNQRIAARRQRTAVTSIPNTGVATTVALGSVTFNSGCDTSVASTITIVVAGLYRISGACDWDTNAVTSRYSTQPAVNGSVVCSAAFVCSVAEANTNGAAVTCLAQLNAGDDVTLEASQTSGGATDTGNFTHGTYLEVELIARS